jgi:hypothetical protein
MDKRYADTVRLLLAITPSVFANGIFALKGGTAINLFVDRAHGSPSPESFLPA